MRGKKRIDIYPRRSALKRMSFKILNVFLMTAVGEGSKKIFSSEGSWKSGKRQDMINSIYLYMEHRALSILSGPGGQANNILRALRSLYCRSSTKNISLFGHYANII